jgi:hypothetical protein
MSIFVLPPLLYAMSMWPTGPNMDSERKTELLRDAVKPYFRVTGIVISVYLLLFMGGVLPRNWHVDRLVAFFVGQSFFGFVIFVPLYLVPTADGADVTSQAAASTSAPSESDTKKSD